MGRPLFLFLGAALLCGAAAPAVEITRVSLNKASFNPSLGEDVTIGFELSAKAAVTVSVYDPDRGLVKVLLDGVTREAGRQLASWNGRDSEHQLVPDEAYTFTVEAGDAVYDPFGSGGVVGDLTEAEFDRQSGTVNYSLPAASRVLIRLGIRSGPMLKTLVDWKPRTGGAVTEYWDGRDENGMFDLRSDPGFTALITYVTLPPATVIAYGNREESYREVKLGRARERPLKPQRPAPAEAADRLRPEGLVPPAWARAPRVALGFPASAAEDEGTPELSGEAAVRVDVDPQDRDRLLEEQFEILFFVDNVFFAEAERGHLPFNWRWELQQIPPGEHLLTVNVSSFKGQVGVATRKVRVVEGR